MPDFYSIQDVLAFAIRLEQASQEFYLHLIQKAHSPSVGRYLAQLVKEEKLHEQRLLQLLKDSGGFATQHISSDEVAGYIQAIKVPDSLDYKEAVRLAMDKENAARMLYSVIAKVTEDPSLREVFLRLSEQEKIHQAFFEKEYRSICLSEN